MASKPTGAAAVNAPMHMSPKYQPKVTVRISCGRTKQVAEFAVDLPTTGVSPLAYAETHEKMSDIFRRLGILAPIKPLSERANAQGNLQAEEEQEKSA